MNTQSPALDVALLALKLGLSPMVPYEDGSKRPFPDIRTDDGAWTWAPYQTTPATVEHVRGWFSNGRTSIGLATGYGDAVCLDFDSRETYDDFLELAPEAGLGDLVDKIRTGYEEFTPGGVHWLFRCPDSPCTKLAMRPAPTAGNPNNLKTLIEVKGIGGFIIIAPSNGKVHDTGGAYKLVSGGLGLMTVLFPDERDALYRFAQTFDETAEEISGDAWDGSAKPSSFATRAEGGDPADFPEVGVRPGDDLDARASWDDVLVPGGYVKLFTNRKGVTYWRRPDKKEGWSATTGHCKGLKVFSSSTPFSQRGTHTKFHAYAVLNHRGDFKEATKALAQAGFGTWIDDDGTEKQNPVSKEWFDKRRAAKEAAAPKDVDIDDAEIVDRWPKMGSDAFYGLPGDIVRLCQDQTEADPVAILLQVLVGFGNLVGRRVYFVVGATRHYLNMFVALVGLTSVGRKGTSWDVAQLPLANADPDWASNRVAGGLVSGEGLIFHVRDPVIAMKQMKDPETNQMKRIPVEMDAGVKDKRLMVLETEMGRMLKAMNRDTSTLSDVIRQCWDSGNLRTLNRKEPLKATGAHVSIIAHVTDADVQKYLMANDAANGFANRFVWACTRRSRVLPEGGDLFGLDWKPIQDRIGDAVRFARDPFEVDPDWTQTAGESSGGNCRRMKRDDAARKSWNAVYEELSGGKAGLLGLVLSRAEAQVMRLACLYALLDCSPVVRVEHLGAAIAVWEYCAASARLVFGDGLGDPDQERLLKALREAPEGLTRTEIANDVFGKHKKRNELIALLGCMLTQGLIHRVEESGGKGRRPERWFDGRGPK